MALQVLTAHQHLWDDADRNHLIMIKAKFAEYKEKLRKKLASDAELTTMHAQIKHVILEFSKILKK